MSSESTSGIHLTKDYYKDFIPTDLQWEVTKIDEDFTLYDLFKLVYTANGMIQNLPATMGMTYFSHFWEQINKRQDTKPATDINYLELYWDTSYEILETPKTGKHTDQAHSSAGDNTKNYWEDVKKCTMSNLMSFHGVGTGCSMKDLDLHECGNDCCETTYYGIEFSPINELAHLPIVVKPIVAFYPPYVESDKEFKRTAFSLEMYPTLWCLITSIFWELTFVGNRPSDIAEAWGHVKNTVDQAKKQLEGENNNDVG